MPAHTSNRRSQRFNPAIILVGDIHKLANMLERKLRQSSEYTLIHALYLSDILKHITKRIIPLMIIDDTTAGIDSFALLHEIKRISPDTRILLIVPSASQAQEQRARAAGADYYMAQTFASYQLGSIIEAVIK
jgi:DNA-binding response OmpR family regulator